VRGGLECGLGPAGSSAAERALPDVQCLPNGGGRRPRCSFQCGLGQLDDADEMAGHVPSGGARAPRPERAPSWWDNVALAGTVAYDVVRDAWFEVGG
jgi:hypothetical protein